MSESYTTGGDTLQKTFMDIWAGQTFRVVETHTLQWIDLQLKDVQFINQPLVAVFKAGGDHKPYGSAISGSNYIINPYKTTFGLKRYRFSMSPVELIPAEYYVIQVRCYPSVLQPPTYWQYDAGDATYPRGVRISSTDSGETWQIYENDDHMFVEFGVPPTPPLTSNPPITNVATLGLGWTQTADGLHLRTWTSVPCHMYFYWTNTPPEKHLESILRRGIPFTDALRYCFVTFHINEQIEPGDTLYHSFRKEPWPVCETRYIVFRSTIDGEWSPSLSPIFTKHNVGFELKRLILEPWTWKQTFAPDYGLLILEPWGG